MKRYRNICPAYDVAPLLCITGLVYPVCNEDRCLESNHAMMQTCSVLKCMQGKLQPGCCSCQTAQVVNSCKGGVVLGTRNWRHSYAVRMSQVRMMLHKCALHADQPSIVRQCAADRALSTP